MVKGIEIRLRGIIILCIGISFLNPLAILTGGMEREIVENEITHPYTPPKTWIRTYSGKGFTAWLLSTKPTQDGGYIFFGSTSGDIEGPTHAWIVKVDAYGLIEWEKFLNPDNGGAGSLRGGKIIQCSDGKYLVASSKGKGERYDLWLIKLSNDGKEEWHSVHVNENNYNSVGKDVLETTDGFIICAEAHHPKYLTSYLWLVKVDKIGKQMWNKSIGNEDEGNPSEFVVQIKKTKDGKFLIGGTKEYYGRDFPYPLRRVWLLKLDENGNTVLEKEYGEGEIDYWCNSIDRTIDGGCIITGVIHDKKSFSFKGIVIKVDSKGEVEWKKTYEENPYYIEQTSDGGYILTGYSSGDVLLSKTNNIGEVEWRKVFSFGTIDDEWGEEVHQTSDGGYIIGGCTVHYITELIGKVKAFLIKTDENGRVDKARAKSTIDKLKPDKILQKINLIKNCFLQNLLSLRKKHILSVLK